MKFSLHERWPQLGARQRQQPLTTLSFPYRHLSPCLWESCFFLPCHFMFVSASMDASWYVSLILWPLCVLSPPCSQGHVFFEITCFKKDTCVLTQVIVVLLGNNTLLSHKKQTLTNVWDWLQSKNPFLLTTTTDLHEDCLYLMSRIAVDFCILDHHSIL